MSKVVVAESEDMVLVFDTDDVESFATPRDHMVVDEQQSRLVGPAKLVLTFKHGKSPCWEEKEAASNG
jgi:hypothetical protein